MSALAAPARSSAAAGVAGRTSRRAATAAQNRRPMRAPTPAAAEACVLEGPTKSGLLLQRLARLGHGVDLLEAHGPVALLDADEPAGADVRAIDVDLDGV